MNADELRARMAQFPTPTAAPPIHSWERNRYELARDVARGDPEKMLQWATLHATMFVGDTPFVQAELRALEALDDWRRWRYALRQPEFGAPPRLPYATYTTGNAVHQATHAEAFERLMGLRLDEVESIVEFGGGFGATRVLLHRLGFRGDYVIYDSPEYSLLQRYYLSNALPGVPTTFREVNDGSFDAPGETGLLIACYSLSEVRPDLRERFLAQTDARAYMFAIQHTFFGMDLIADFRAYTDTRKDVRWEWGENLYFPGHVYIAGVRTDPLIL